MSNKKRVLGNCPAERDPASQEKFSPGFTVIELLVVIVVMGVVGTIIAAIMLNTLMGTKKANTITAVRQNGNYAINQMVKMIRYAPALDGLSNDNFATTPVKNCAANTPLGQPTPTPVPFQQIRFITDDQGNTTTFSCMVDGNGKLNIASQGAATVFLLDSTKAQVTSCTFTCLQNGSATPPTIGIQFTLEGLQETSPGVYTPGNFVESQATVPFETTVTLRNFNR